MQYDEIRIFKKKILYQFNFVMPCNYIELFFARLKLKCFSIAFAMVKYFNEKIVKKKQYHTALQS